MYKYFDGSDPLVFAVPGNGNPAVKCSYEPNDSFLIYVFDYSNNTFSSRRCKTIFQSDSDPTYTYGGISSVNQLIPVEVNNYGVSPPILNVPADVTEKIVTVTTNYLGTWSTIM